MYVLCVCAVICMAVKVFVDALLGNTAEKSAELKKKARQMLQYSSATTSTSTSTSSASLSTASDRLKASFNRNPVVPAPEANAASGKPKRPKRVKPAAAKKKK